MLVNLAVREANRRRSLDARAHGDSRSVHERDFSDRETRAFVALEQRGFVFVAFVNEWAPISPSNGALYYPRMTDGFLKKKKEERLMEIVPIAQTRPAENVLRRVGVALQIFATADRPSVFVER